MAVSPAWGCCSCPNHMEDEKEAEFSRFRCWIYLGTWVCGWALWSEVEAEMRAELHSWERGEVQAHSLGRNTGEGWLVWVWRWEYPGLCLAEDQKVNMVDNMTCQEDNQVTRNRMEDDGFSPKRKSRRVEWSWTNFHCALLLGVAGFLLFWILLLLRSRYIFHTTNNPSSVANITLNLPNIFSANKSLILPGLELNKQMLKAISI